MGIITLLMTLSLVVIALGISKKHQLGLEKDLFLGAVRAFGQLMIVGYILKFVFDSESFLYTSLMIAIMILVASHNVAKKGEGISNVFLITIISISVGTVSTLVIMVSLNIIQFEPRFLIPISGMIVGNSMVAGAIALNQLKKEIGYKKGEILAALALGATSKQASQRATRASIKAGMIPTIEGMKTIGLVQLPGMMTGAILAGEDPLVAVRLQIMVSFMLTGSVALSCSTLGLLAYQQFFTKAHQLKDI